MKIIFRISKRQWAVTAGNRTAYIYARIFDCGFYHRNRFHGFSVALLPLDKTIQ
jgi:hypothetical protein